MPPTTTRTAAARADGLNDRLARRSQAFLLIHDMQAGHPEAAAQLSALARRSDAEGFPEVGRIGLLGRAIEGWLTQDGSLTAALEALLRRSEHEGDQIMYAVALAMRSDLPLDGRSRAAGDGPDADLARATVLLDEVEGGALEAITAHTACGIAFGNRALWELSEEQYAAAFRAGEHVTGAARDALLSAVVFNRAENHVAWASALRQIGDRAGVIELWQAWQGIFDTSGDFAFPPSWRLELSALGYLLAAAVGHDVGEEAGGLLPGLSGDPGRQNPTSAHLRLAVALSAAGAGRPDATRSAADAVAAIDPVAHPHMYDLALGLAAELEARSGQRAGLRFAERLLRQHWADRLGRLSTMRTRMQAERLLMDHDRLTREAKSDHLTGIGNRRALAGYLDDLRRQDVARVALIMTDIDGFKAVNDCHGHHSGDATLVRIARVLDGSIRPSDRAFRLGGDEFIVVMPDVDVAEAGKQAEAVMAAIAALPWTEVSAGLRVTVSIGVAAGLLSGLDTLSVHADAAVYRAKAVGGNSIVCWESD